MMRPWLGWSRTPPNPTTSPCRRIRGSSATRLSLSSKVACVKLHLQTKARTGAPRGGVSGDDMLQLENQSMKPFTCCSPPHHFVMYLTFQLLRYPISSLGKVANFIGARESNSESGVDLTSSILLFLPSTRPPRHQRQKLCSED